MNVKVKCNKPVKPPKSMTSPVTPKITDDMDKNKSISTAWRFFPF